MLGFAACVLAERFLGVPPGRGPPRAAAGAGPLTNTQAASTAARWLQFPSSAFPRSILGATLFLAPAKPFLEEIL